MNLSYPVAPATFDQENFNVLLLVAAADFITGAVSTVLAFFVLLLSLITVIYPSL